MLVGHHRKPRGGFDDWIAHHLDVLGHLERLFEQCEQQQRVVEQLDGKWNARVPTLGATDLL
jgi:hypothetical protein